MATKTKFHVIEATHWDREWRFPFEATRKRLVAMMDELLEIVESDTTGRCHHLDGQSIPLDDYLAVRPANRQRLQAACRAGKILAGPWYTLPEENLLLGESLVRNLLLGRRACRDFGGAMAVGYTPASYGQVSQMPQVLAGFGIDSILFYRGINSEAARGAEFFWEGPDGSRVLAFRFSDYGRANFFHLVYRPVIYGRDRSQQQRRWSDGGTPLRLCGSASTVPFELMAPSRGWHPQQIPQALEELAGEIRDNTTPHALAMQTQDSLWPCAELPKLVAALNDHLGREAFVISSLPDYVAAVRAAAGDLEVLTGEMRHPQKDQTLTDLHPHIFPVRAYLKQANRAAELALGRWAEPAAALAWLLGADYPGALLDRAWRMLVANHAHDSLSGAAMDAVHEDTMHRNRQVRILADELTVAGLGGIAAAIDPEDLDGGDVLFVVFNPSPRSRGEVVAAELDVHVDDDFEHFDLLDASGRTEPVQAGPARERLAIFQSPYELPLRMPARSRPFHFHARDVPALGYKTYRLRRGGGGASPEGGGLVRGEALVNEFLRVDVNANGSYDLTNRETQRVFRGLGLLEDDGEAGDPWVRVPPADDRLVTSADGWAKVAVVEDGPLSASLSVRLALPVPVCVEGLDGRRSDELVELDVEHLLTVRAGCCRLEVTTRLVNVARDHRLRVAFPTGLTGAACSVAETPFDVVARAVRVPPADGWREPPSPCHPHLGFVDVFDGAEGLALLNFGIGQYELRDDEQRTLLLTLMRCFAQKNTVRRAEYPDQTGSQCLFAHEFRYALLPHTGDWQAANLPDEAEAFLLPMKVAQVGRSGGGELPRAMSFFELRPASLELSAVKRCEDRDRLLLRIFNPTDREVAGELRCFRPPAEARELTLAEEPLAPLPVDGQRVPLKVAHKKIVTIELAF